MKKLSYYLIATFVFSAISAEVNLFAAGAIGQLDSIIYNLNDVGQIRKASYEYVNKQLSATTVYEFSNSAWTPSQRTIYSSASDIQSSVVRNYDVAKNDYVNSLKTDLQFDSKGHRTLEAYYAWDDTSSLWKGYRNKIEKSYTDTGEISSFSYSSWDSIANNWKLFSQGTTQFTAFRKPLNTLYSAPNAYGTTVYSSKTEYAYLPNNKLEFETTFVYNESTSNFTPSFRNHIEYAETAPQYRETVETFNATNQKWIPSQKIERTTDINGNLSRMLISDNDTINNLWVERYRHDFVVLNNSVDSIHIQQTDAPDGATRFVRKYKQITDSNGILRLTSSTEQNNLVINSELRSFAMPSVDITSMGNTTDDENIKLEWDYNPTNNTLVNKSYSIDSKTNSEILTRSATFYFNANATKILNAVEDKKLSFWPNPVRDALNITNQTGKTASYKIISLDGKPVTSGQVFDSVNKVNVADLQPGAYLIQLSSDKKNSKTRVFIKL
jgi:hypothetical protein